MVRGEWGRGEDVHRAGKQTNPISVGIWNRVRPDIIVTMSHPPQFCHPASCVKLWTEAHNGTKTTKKEKYRQIPTRQLLYCPSGFVY